MSVNLTEETFSQLIASSSNISNFLDNILFEIGIKAELRDDYITHKRLLKATQIDINYLDPNHFLENYNGEINQFRKKQALLKAILSSIRTLKKNYTKEVYDDLQRLKTKLRQYLDLNIIGLSILLNEENRVETNYFIREKSKLYFNHRFLSLKRIKRDKRRLHRTIINIIYKNLDDEEHGKILSHFVKKNFANFINFILNDNKLPYSRTKYNFGNSRFILT